MGLDLLLKFSVNQIIKPEGKEFDIFKPMLASDEDVYFLYAAARDRVMFTDRKIITYDVQGITGTKKEYRIFPYSKITSFSVETSGLIDCDSDFKVWVSGVGVFEIRFGANLNIIELGSFLASKVK